MKGHSLSRLEISGATFLLWLTFFCGALVAGNVAGAPVPDRRELWVPSDQLKEVLAKNPKAILLSREQYETLTRDAGRVMKQLEEPPRKCTLGSARYTA
ncbi:MAG: hypothetical protein V4710_17390, partial [Verrucomicrobiota bacterium]